MKFTVFIFTVLLYAASVDSLPTKRELADKGKSEERRELLLECARELIQTRKTSEISKSKRNSANLHKCVLSKVLDKKRNEQEKREVGKKQFFFPPSENEASSNLPFAKSREENLPLIFLREKEAIARVDNADKESKEEREENKEEEKTIPLSFIRTAESQYSPPHWFWREITNDKSAKMKRWGGYRSRNRSRKPSYVLQPYNLMSAQMYGKEVDSSDILSNSQEKGHDGKRIVKLPGFVELPQTNRYLPISKEYLIHEKRIVQREDDHGKRFVKFPGFSESSQGLYGSLQTSSSRLPFANGYLAQGKRMLQKQSQERRFVHLPGFNELNQAHSNSLPFSSDDWLHEKRMLPMPYSIHGAQRKSAADSYFDQNQNLNKKFAEYSPFSRRYGK